MPPELLLNMSGKFNRSQARFLICFHDPPTMIEDYGFNIELIVQVSTRMHGPPGEQHMCYIYHHTGIQPINASKRLPCDPLFLGAWMKSQEGLESLRKDADGKVQAELDFKYERTRKKPIWFHNEWLHNETPSSGRKSGKRKKSGTTFKPTRKKQKKPSCPSKNYR